MGSMVTILSTQLFTASEFFVGEALMHANRSGDFEYYYKSYMFYHVFRSTDAIVSTLYIMLSFKFNHKYYRKMCSLCQNECMDCWLKIARSRMRPDSPNGNQGTVPPIV